MTDVVDIRRARREMAKRADVLLDRLPRPSLWDLDWLIEECTDRIARRRPDPASRAKRPKLRLVRSDP